MSSIQSLLTKTVNTLHEKGFEVSKPYINERSSINIVARSNEKLLIVKALSNVNELKSYCITEIKKAGYALRGSPLVVSDKEIDEEIDKEVIYEKQGIYALHVDALRKYLEGKRWYVYCKGGRFYVKIDGERLRRLREKIGLSLGGLANLLGISRKAVYEYERDEMDATIDVAIKLYEILREFVNEDEALQAFKPIDIPIMMTSPDIRNHDERFKARRYRLQEEVASKLLKLGFSVLRFRGAPFNLIAKGDNGKKTILILAIETLDERTREEAEVLRDVAEVAKVKGLIVTRKVSHENEGVISSRKLESISNPDELIEITSSS
ncbi:MAG: helix-turn-helix domain-containing protein [Candidatus Nezhaarchaeota archaeon]|nr:helix-turn-helix domain-containing protein [Candidatus Nezhaarchaeota archaeon]MCX8141976.1 helix-turn-helix domain-containing protein [Candidatus Nezhaarchaeota archaeon]MDW8050243.1 helix-turn-helix domain-containing protein [Nitrososphaerota archaeon]